MELPTKSQQEAVAQDIGESLKHWRKEAGATQAQIGQAIGEHRAMIARYETGQRMIPLARLYAFCEALYEDYGLTVSPSNLISRQSIWAKARSNGEA